MPEQSLSVTQVAAMIRGALETPDLQHVRVVGEISNLSDRTHWFFSLKDGGAALRCVMFASATKRCASGGFKAKDGMEVVATGRVDFYDAQGAVQLYVDRLEPVGVGALEAELRALMAELRELGYFELERKRELPGLPRKVAVVTSGSGAALQDVIDTAGRRWAGCELVLVDVRVQGPDAAPQIVEALDALSEYGQASGIDAIILTRGGGSIEDLWAFNERAVADAVLRCELPIVAAIGHETDTTIAELVADVRCATPTQAAMTVVPEAEALHEQVTQMERRLRVSLTHRLDHFRGRVESAARSSLLRDPRKVVAEASENLARAESRLLPAVRRHLERKSAELVAARRHLEAVGPQKVLERGFTYTTDADGNVLRKAKQAHATGTLTTVFVDGSVRSVVDEDASPKPQDGATSQSKPKPKRKPKRGGGGPSLFGP
ncbi:MAG: exodeoxyribonuclease VII large subunit [Planctomycetota bacterium]